MPLIENITYKPSLFYRSTHINTIYTALWRPALHLNYERERIETPDDDFIDLDWSKVGSDKLLICVHGLEGHARKPYMRGMMHHFNQDHGNNPYNKNVQKGWDSVGINLRGCSGEENRLLYSYHSGKSEDLDLVVEWARTEKKYKQIAIVGFSIGGNIVLKYAGEKGKNIPLEVTHVIGFSVPCDLTSSSIEIEKRKNWLYLTQFLLTLKPKARQKALRFPNTFDLKKAMKARNFREFDTAYTAPVNGYIDCFDYWDNASCLPHLKNIAIPALLINAKDDTFLSSKCFPYDIAEQNPHFHLEVSHRGGHLGFMSTDTEGYIWTEHRAWNFIHSSALLPAPPTLPDSLISI